MLRPWQRSAGDAPWRNAERGMAEYWKWGAGESLVAGELDAWTGQFAGSVVQAPFASQRPVAGPSEWTFASGNQNMLVGAAALAASLQGAVASTVLVVGKATGTGVLYGFADSAASIGWKYLGRIGATTMRYARNDGGSENVDSSVTWGTDRHVVGVSYDGSDSRSYDDGALVSGPDAHVNNPTPLDVFAMGVLPDLTPALYLTGAISEVQVYNVQKTTAEIAAITARLQAEYP